MPNRQYRAFSRPSAGSALAISVGLMLSMSASLARAEITPLVWSEAGVFEAKLPVAAGKFAEVCGPVAEGQRIAWQFEADQALDFNIHFHQGKQVSFPERHKQLQRAQGELKVGAPQDHCWMWSNKGTSAGTLTLRLTRL